MVHNPKMTCFALKGTDDNTNNNMEHSSYVYNTNNTHQSPPSVNDTASFHTGLQPLQHLNRIFHISKSGPFYCLVSLTEAQEVRGCVR